MRWKGVLEEAQMLPSWDYVSCGNCKAPASCLDRLCLQTDWPLRTSHCHILLQTTALLRGTWVLRQGQKPNSKYLEEEKQVSALSHRTCKAWQCWLGTLSPFRLTMLFISNAASRAVRGKSLSFTPKSPHLQYLL